MIIIKITTIKTRKKKKKWFKRNLKQLRVENCYTYNTVQLVEQDVAQDVAQRLFNKCTATQMSFESGFKCFCQGSVTSV